MPGGGDSRVAAVARGTSPPVRGVNANLFGYVVFGILGGDYFALLVGLLQSEASGCCILKLQGNRMGNV